MLLLYFAPLFGFSGEGVCSAHTFQKAVNLKRRGREGRRHCGSFSGKVREMLAGADAAGDSLLPSFPGAG